MVREAFRWERWTPWIMLGLFAGFLLLRLPFRAEFLVNWDAANFALGIRQFDLEHHQPHPPGYIGYVMLGRALKPLAGDANAALTWLSVVSGALAPAGFYLLARRFMAGGFALGSALLLGVSPPVWYYSAVALTYGVELALGVFFLWAAYEARARRSLGFLAAATVLLVALGAVRQSGGLLMSPLWLYTVWAFPWRVRGWAVAGLVAGNLSWLVPLVALSGGPTALYRASADLAGLAVAPTSIFSLQAGGLGQNLVIVLVGLVLGGHVGLMVLAAALALRPRATLGPFRGDGLYFGLWLVPALATYLLLHTGQLGYVLLLLPAVFLGVGAALQAWVPAPGAATALRARRWVLPGLAGLCGVVGVVLSLLVGPALHNVARGAQPGGQDDPWSALADLPLFRTVAREDGMVLDGVRQFDLRAHDRYWGDLIALADTLDPERTRVLTTPERVGTFRGLTYYIPEHTVLGVGHDLEREYGHLFTARGGTSDYSIEGLEEASSSVPLPVGVRYLLAPDREVKEALREGGELPTEVQEETVRVGVGGEVLLLRVPTGTGLRAEGGHDPWADDGERAAPALILETDATANP